MLLTEVARALRYPKLPKRIAPEKAAALINWVRDHGTLADDPASPPPVGSRDPDDDYLLGLAISRRAYQVTGDQDLLVLGGELPILTPAQFATELRQSDLPGQRPQPLRVDRNPRRKSSVAMRVANPIASVPPEGRVPSWPGAVPAMACAPFVAIPVARTRGPTTNRIVGGRVSDAAVR